MQRAPRGCRPSTGRAACDPCRAATSPPSTCCCCDVLLLEIILGGSHHVKLDEPSIFFELESKKSVPNFKKRCGTAPFRKMFEKERPTQFMIDLHSPVRKKNELVEYKKLSYCLVQTHKNCG